MWRDIYPSLNPSVCYPPDIMNGDTEPSSPLEPGAALQIFCSEGYSLSVMPNIVCQEDGTFGDTAIPECVGSYFNVVSECVGSYFNLVPECVGSYFNLVPECVGSYFN